MASSGAELIIGRGLQGVFAAMLAPAALSLLTVTFSHGKDRNTAFAIFGTIAGTGAAIGLVLGGVLTEYADWRWCLLVNVFFVIVALVGGLTFLTESKAQGDNKYDVWGAVTVTLGLGALVYGFSLTEYGWTNTQTIGFLALGVILLALFVWIESKVAQPLLPLHIVIHRVRGGALLIQAISGIMMIGVMLYLTFHLQIVLGMAPLQSGLASLPMTLSIMAMAPIATKLLSDHGPRIPMVGGPILVAAGLFYLSQVTANGSYAAQVLPALIIMGCGMGFVFVPLQNLALTGVEPKDAGAASATANSAMQIGGSIGVSVFTALYVSAKGSTTDLAGKEMLEALANGHSAVFMAAAFTMLAGSVIAMICIRGSKSQLAVDEDAPVMVHAG